MPKAETNHRLRIDRFAKGIQLINGDRIGFTPDRQHLIALPDLAAGDVAHVLIGTSGVRGYWSQRAAVRQLARTLVRRGLASFGGRAWCEAAIYVATAAVRS